MSLKKLVTDLSAKTADDEVQKQVAKILMTTNNQSSSNVAQITKINGPSSFDVTVNGQTKTITYIGDRPVGKGANIILVGGNYGQ